MSISASNRSATALTVAGLLVAGCAVGPNFSRPAPPALDRYATAPQRLAGDGAVQIVEAGRAPDAAWWRLFGSPALDDLVATGLKNSPSLVAAEAALAESRDQARAGAGVFFPSVAGSASYTREQSAPLRLGIQSPPSTFNLYTLAGSISYVLDVFGGERRSVEALVAAEDRQRYAVGAAYLTLTGNIVQTAIARAGYAEQARTLEDLVGLDADERDTLRAQYQSGYGALAAVLVAEQQLAADRQALEVTRQRLQASANLLRTLLGRENGDALPAAPTLADLSPPYAAPVALPSQVVRLRPDILEAEAALHQASAQVGVATAALFPSISLTGDYGATSLSLGKLGSPQGVFWGIGPAVNVPIFQGGALWFGRRAAQAAFRQAQANYRQTVLSALEQVSDSLEALDVDARVAAAYRTADDAASLNDTLGDANLRSGVIAGSDRMALHILADRSRLDLIAARAQRLQDVVALYLASGGGWNGRDAVAANGAEPAK